MAKEDSELEAMKRLLRGLKDARATVFMLLLEAHRPVSKIQISKLLNLPDWTRDRALEFLYKSGFVEKLSSVSPNGRETYYFAVLP